jgi:hypothetical protein
MHYSLILLLAAIYGGTLVLSIVALMYDKATKGSDGYEDMDDGDEMKSMQRQERTI